MSLLKFLTPNNLNQTMRNAPQFFPGSELIIVPILAVLFLVALVITSICSCFSNVFGFGQNSNRGYGQTVIRDNSYYGDGYQRGSTFGSLFDSGPNQPYVNRTSHYNSTCYNSAPSQPYIAPSSVCSSSPNAPYVAPSNSNINSGPFFHPSSSQTVSSNYNNGPSAPNLSQMRVG